MDDGDVVRELINVPGIGERESLVDTVYRTLQEAITSGTLGPGVRLRESVLAKRLGVSATPVREAIRLLEREGLVETSPHRGASVAGVSLREVMDLYELREVLETHAVRRAAEAPACDLSRLDPILAAAEVAAAQADHVEFNRLDVSFHRVLNDFGGNAPLAEMAERVHRRIQGVRVACAIHLPDRPAVSLAEHRAIVQAVREQDAALAESLVRDHIRTVRGAVIRVLQDATGEGVA